MHSQASTYSPQIEEKWQQYWEKEGLYTAPAQPKGPTCYVLDMFPYPSGAGLHVGHPLGYIASDIYARYKRMKGYTVLHPMGFDAFGLPAEQYAIETGQHPAQTTAENTARYKKQLQRLGLSYDWNRELRTSDPAFYRWTQWMFGLFFKSWYNKEKDRAEDISTLVKQLGAGGTAAVHAASDAQAPNFTATAWKKASPVQQAAWLLHYRLAYLDEVYVNWCPALGTVLSNDEVKEGYSERGGHPVLQRPMQQWMLRIRAYAERLLKDMEQLQWPKAILDMQRHWMGRSEGIEIDFQVEGGKSLRVFTTRADTIYGVTFLCLSPGQAPQLSLSAAQAAKLKAFITKQKKTATLRPNEGFFTGVYARHPLTGQKIPVWVADYVLESYGTGVIMAVPAHDARDFAFAQKYGLPMRQVIAPPKPCEGAYEGKEGTMLDSGPLTGLSAEEGRAAAPGLLSQKTRVQKKINYRLRDAIFARQRYWGEPLPVYYKEGVPQLLPEEQLPLRLPPVDAYLPTDSGDPPLARAQNWHTKEGHPYEKSTMPGWAGSSWYFFRYMDPHNEKAFCAPEALAAWKQVDLYVGGAEHAVGHLIYARFWTKFLYDRGWVPVKEFAKKLVNQGMIYGRSFFVYRIKGENKYVSYGLRKNYESTALHVENHLVSEEQLLDTKAFCSSRSHRKDATFVLEEGKYRCGTEIEKMSKSKHNVINPDPLLSKYGADTLRLYEMFLGPLEQSKPWDTQGMDGSYRFLKKVWRLFHSPAGQFFVSEAAPSEAEQRILHKAIHKVRQDTEALALNTAVSTMMIAVNGLQALKCHKRAILEPLLLLLCPYAPHIAEELWHKCGHSSSVTQQPFPKAEARYLHEEQITYPISINGKVRAQITVPSALSEAHIEQQALDQEAIQRWLEGKKPKKVIIVRNKIVNIVV